MSDSGGYAVTRSHGSDRFYNPPAARRNQQQHQQQQQMQSRRVSKSDTRFDSAETDNRADPDEPTLWRLDSVGLSSPPRTSKLTNLDRLMESATPFVPAQFLSERMKGWKTPEFDGNTYFCLGDLWKSFREWSAYGVEVPLMLNGSESVKQYYVPYLSGIQLYVEPHRLSSRSEDCDAESSKETSSAGSSDCEAERRAKGGVDGAWMQRNLMNINSQRLSKLTLRDKPPSNSSSDETEECNSTGLLVFEYFEEERPHFRPPFYDKVDGLASQFPDLNKYRSCDLLPSSWFSVAWYPIYRIPIGSTLKSLDASFLTFHSLSTRSRSKNQSQLHASNDGKVHGLGASVKISLPVFALAFYKLRGSILYPGGASEWQQADSLLQAADNWLQHLKVKHPDYQYFVNHSSKWR